MKHGVISSAVLAALLAAPVAVWADTNPDFDDDAKPILQMQPGLLQYVESRFEVKDSGTAKFPGDDDRRPQPPFIFRARPVGSHGPYNLRLLIQPGGPGHILGVVDITKVHMGNPAPGRPQGPEVAGPGPAPQQPAPSSSSPSVQVPELSGGAVEQQPAQQQPAPAQQQAPPPASQPQPSEPTADTPSGPITESNGKAQAPAQPSLAPPPDPAPPAQ